MSPDIEDLFPMTPMQRGMLYHLLQPDSASYVVQWCCTLVGRLSARALEEAWATVISRHASLRSAYVSRPADLQVVHRRAHFRIGMHDWSGVSEGTGAERLAAFLSQDRTTRLNHKAPPVMRVALIRLSDARHFMIWTHHHIVLDAWSGGVILRELLATYEGITGGRAEPLVPPPHYGAYVEWLSRQNLGEAEEFFRQELDALANHAYLGSKDGSPRPRARVEVPLPPDATEQLRARARKGGFTLAAFVHGLWAIALGRRRDVLLGSTFSGRSAPVAGIENMVGLFANVLPVRVRPANPADGDDWFRKLDGQQAALRAYEYIPIARIRSACGLSGPQPLFDSVLVFQNHTLKDSLRALATSLEIHDVAVSDEGTYPCTFSVVPRDHLELLLTFDEALFSRHSATRLAEALAQGAKAAANGAPLEEIASAVAAWGSARTPSVVRVTPAPAAVAAATDPADLETRVLETWRRVLEAPALIATDSFFDQANAGSLLAVRLIVELEREIGRTVPISWLFEGESARGMTRLMEGGVAGRSVLDLRGEVVLDPAVRGREGHESSGPAKNVLLTGCTGFLGVHLLSELLLRTTARVYCLVRGASVGDGSARVRASLQRAGLWDERFGARITPVLGDLALPRLGLSDSVVEELAGDVDMMVHNGALVNFLMPYKRLKGPNVLGTHEVLRLAAKGRPKRVHYVSTLGVFSKHYLGRAVREQDVPEPSGLVRGYVQSKWVAERLVAEAHARGIPAAWYRPGEISGHSDTGYSNEADLLLLLVRASLRLGMVPELAASVDLTPVDYVAKAIVHIASEEAAPGQAYHLSNPEPPSLQLVVDRLRARGYRLVAVAPDEWSKRVARIAQQGGQEELRTLVAVLSAGGGPDAPLALVTGWDYRAAETAKALHSTAIACPAVDARLVDKYLDWFAERRLIPPPPAAEAVSHVEKQPQGGSDEH